MSKGVKNVIDDTTLARLIDECKQEQDLPSFLALQKYNDDDTKS